MKSAENRLLRDMAKCDFEAPGSRLQAPGKLQLPGAKASPLFACWIVLCVGLTGCKNLRPVVDLTHYYVLSASGGAEAGSHSNQDLTIGIAPVEIPAYLQSTRIAVRRGTNEIHFSEYREWAEHLDKGIQRVLALDLSNLVPSSRVVTSAWQGGEVKVEIYASIQRFELDEAGEATLDCQWRIVTPGGSRALRSNRVLIRKKGPPLTNDPAGAVHTLSEAVADLTKEIAAALPTPP